MVQFEGISVKTGEKVTGDLLHISGGCLIYTGSKTRSEKITEEEKKDGVAVALYFDEVEVVFPDSIKMVDDGVHYE